MERENTLPTEYVNGLSREQAAEAENAKLHDFYKTVWDKSGNFKYIRFRKDKITDLLLSKGYYRYGSADKLQFVHVDKNRLQLTTETEIKDAFEDYINALKPIIAHNPEMPNYLQTIDAAMLRECLYDHLSDFANIFDRLRAPYELKPIADDRTHKFLFFQNTAVAVTGDAILPLDYSQLKNCIWSSSILPRDFHYSTTKGDYEKFIEDITGSDDQRKRSLMSILGYLMHNYFDNDLRAAFFTDVNNDQIGEAAGRTGKGLIGKGLAHILNRDDNSKIYIAAPGKDFKADKDTRYSFADASTCLIHIEDAPKKFDLEQLYCDITDGAKIRQLYGNAQIRKVKIMISINHTIELGGDSDKGRLIIFEVANYFNAKFRPMDKYKRWFFGNDWTDNDWNAFYSFMCRCAQTYLKHGIIEADEVNYSNRSLLEHVPEDFVYWFEEFLRIDLLDKQEHSYSKEMLYNTFTQKYKDYTAMRQTTFSKWCSMFCKTKQIPYCTVRSTVDKFYINPTKDTFSKAR